VTTQNRLDEIRERLEKATPDMPWHYGHQDEHQSTVEIENVQNEWSFTVDYGAKSSFLFAAPTDIAFLLSTIQKLQELNGEYEKSLEYYANRVPITGFNVENGDSARQALAQKSKILGEQE